MRKVYKDPAEELRLLAADGSSLSYIAVTKEEMRALLRHIDREAIFPSYFRDLNAQLTQHNEKLREIKIQKNRKDIFEEERQRLFDREYEIEIHVKALTDAVPNEVMTKYGIPVRISLR
jgi:hypothetical protein